MTEFVVRTSAGTLRLWAATRQAAILTALELVGGSVVGVLREGEWGR